MWIGEMPLWTCVQAVRAGWRLGEGGACSTGRAGELRVTQLWAAERAAGDYSSTTGADVLEKKIERLASEKEANETPLQTTASVEDTEDRTPTSTPPPTKDDTMSYSEATCPRERTKSEGSFIPAKSRGSRRKPTVSQASNQKIDNENKPPQHGKCPRVENGAHGTESNGFTDSERPKSANTRKTKNPARFPTPASEDLLSRVSDRKDQTERVVLYVGNLKVGTTFESLTTYVTERSKNIGVRCPEVFNGKVFQPQTDNGTYCARITVDEESAEALADRSFWPRPLYVRPWKFNRKQQRGRPDNVQSTSGIDQQPPASDPLANAYEFLLDVSLWNPSLINQAPSPVLWRLCAHRQQNVIDHSQWVT